MQVFGVALQVSGVFVGFWVFVGLQALGWMQKPVKPGEWPLDSLGKASSQQEVTCLGSWVLEVWVQFFYVE